MTLRQLELLTKRILEGAEKDGLTAPEAATELAFWFRIKGLLK